MNGVTKIGWVNERILLIQGVSLPKLLFSPSDFLTFFHFYIHFFSFFELYGQAETTSMTTKTKTKIMRVTFLKIFLRNLHDALNTFLLWRILLFVASN